MKSHPVRCDGPKLDQSREARTLHHVRSRSGNRRVQRNDVNSKSKFCLAAITVILPEVVTPLPAEPAEAGQCSPKIRQAILEGLPAYDGQIYRAPIEQPPPIEHSQLAVDPEVVVLPVFTISDSRGTQKVNWSDTLKNTESKTLVAGTGVSEFKFKKFKISVPTILFIPIGLKFSW